MMSCWYNWLMDKLKLPEGKVDVNEQKDLKSNKLPETENGANKEKGSELSKLSEAKESENRQKGSEQNRLHSLNIQKKKSAIVNQPELDISQKKYVPNGKKSIQQRK